MIVLKVTLNEKVIALAGREDLSVLNVIVGASGVLGSESQGTKTEKNKSDFRLHVGGMGLEKNETQGTHYDWFPQSKLSVGDKVEVAILEQGLADEAIEEFPAKSTEAKNSEKVLWEEAKKLYFEHREKYEKGSSY